LGCKNFVLAPERRQYDAVFVSTMEDKDFGVAIMVSLDTIINGQFRMQEQ
jgi:hypothetical protein